MKNTYYITTTLPYVNADPHIGFAAEVLRADVMARYHRLSGKEVLFNTGTDEHGLKIYRNALEQHIDPQKYCDEYAAKNAQLKEALNLSYDRFIRTTDSAHKKAAQEFWLRCDKKGDIYKKTYKIKYCIGCELEKTDSELVDGKCPIHPTYTLEIIDEENYFFRFSNYQKKLLAFYEQNPDFVKPAHRFKEIGNFVKGGLQDFSISRLKKKLPWGVEVPSDADHVMYVWFDALVNYISTLGWPGDVKREFKKFWPGVQVAGKDNLRQQAAMWQAMLMSAGLPNSKQINIFGFINSNGQKMSKSLGNVIDPFEVVKKYGTEATRYFVFAELAAFEDSDFSYEKFEDRYNADLANGLGNLVQRVATLAEKAKFKSQKTKKTASIRKNQYTKLIEAFRFNESLSLIWKSVSEVDTYIDKTKPWTLEGTQLTEALVRPVGKLLEIAYFISPFLPDTGQKIAEIFTASVVKAPKVGLFPRISSYAAY